MNHRDEQEPDGAKDPDGVELLAEMLARRGYVLDLHRLLAAWDPAFLVGYEALFEASTFRDRLLDRRTKELLYVAVLTALSAPREHLIAHLRAAARHGASPQEILEVLELVMAPAGVPRFIEGVEAFTAVFGREPGPDDG